MDMLRRWSQDYIWDWREEDPRLMRKRFRPAESNFLMLQLFATAFHGTQNMMLCGVLFDSEGLSGRAIKSHNILVFKHFSVSGVRPSQHLV